MRAAAPPIRRRLAQSTALAGLLAAMPLPAQTLPLPTGADAGDISLSSDAKTMTVALDPLVPRSVINWDTFDIATGHAVDFTTKGGLSVQQLAVLNRVTGTGAVDAKTITASTINGALRSDDNISVFLVNRAGILFGGGATVKVGSLVASTRDILPGAFTGAVGDQYRFTGTSDADPGLLGDRKITAGSTDAGDFDVRGVVALVAAEIVTRNTIRAGRELAIVAADDTTLTLTPGSPLAVHIAAGTTIDTPMVLRGTLQGSSVIVAAATHNGLTNRLLDIDANLEATSATLTNGRITLAAGITAPLQSVVTIADSDARGAPAQTGGDLKVRIGGTVQAIEAGGAIDMRAKSGIEAQPGGGSATLTAAGGVLVRAAAGDVTLGAVTSRLNSTEDLGVDVLASAGGIMLGAVIAQAASPATGGAGVAIEATGAAARLDSLLAGGNATVSGASVTVSNGARSTAGTLSVTGSTGDVTAASMQAAGLVDVTASDGTVGVSSLVSDTGTVQVRATNVRGTAAGTGASILADQDADVVATGSAAFGSVTADVVRLSAAGALTAGSLTGTTTEAFTGVYASGGTLDVGIADARASTAELSATDGDGAVTSLSAGTDAYLSASGQASLRGGGIVGRDLYVIGDSVLLGGATGGGTQQAGGTALYLARGGAIGAASANTGLTIRGNASDTVDAAIVLDAVTKIDLGGVALVTGVPGDAASGDVGISLSEPDGTLTLGSINATALRSVERGEGYYLSPLVTTGAVTLGDTRLFEGLDLSTPQAVRLGLLAISRAGETLSVSGSAVTATGTLSAQGGVTVSAPGVVALRDVTAIAGNVAVASTGATLKSGALKGTGVSARARAALETGSVDAGAAGAALFSQTAGITGGALTQADGAITLDAPGAIRMSTVTGGSLTVQATGATAFDTVEAGAVTTDAALTVVRAPGIRFGVTKSTGGAVSLTASLGPVSIGATTSPASIAITGTTVTLGSVDAGTSTTLVASTGGIGATGTIAGPTGVTLTAPGAIDVQDVLATDGAVTFGPTTGAGTLKARAVLAKADLDVARAAGLSFTSATSTGGSVLLWSTGGTVAVSGATLAEKGVVAAARSVTLGNVTARGGAIDLTATAGALRTGALLATERIGASVTGSPSVVGNADIADATSSGAEVTLDATGDIRLGGSLSADSFVRASAGGALALRDVSARNGFASLIAGGDLTAGTVGAKGYVYASAAAGVALASAASSDERVELLAGAGRVDVTGAVAADDFVRVAAQTGVELGRVADTGTGASRIVARQGAVKVGGRTSVGGALSIEGDTGVTLDGVVVGGALALDAANGTVIAESVEATGAATLTGRALSVGTLTSADLIATTSATDETLAIGRLTTTGVATITSGGTASLGQIGTGGDLRVTAPGQAVLSGAVDARGDLFVSGGSVRLGSGGPLTQAATGRIEIVAGAGPITGLAGLVLRSDAGGVGRRDLILRSGAGIAFGAGTLIAGGANRDSAVRLAAGSGSPIALDAIEASTIASPDGALLVHDGPLSAERVATGASLTLDVRGNPLTLGAVDVRSGDLSLRADGALATGALTVVGGTTLAGATVATGTVATRGLQVDAAAGAATLGAVDAGADGVRIAAAGDLRLGRIAATGGIALASATGDITGAGTANGFAPLALASTAGSVAVRADATDGTRGIVLLDTAGGAGGVALAGRTITAESLRSAGGRVSASTLRDGTAEGSIAIGTIEAAGPIALATNNGSVALDRARSTGGGIAIATTRSGLASRSGQPATTLSAPTGPVSLAIGGDAVIASASGRTVALTATRLDVGNAASDAALSLRAEGGPLVLGTGTAGGTATLVSGGDLVVDRLTTSGSATATSARDVALGTLIAAGDATLNATRTLAVRSATATGALSLAGATVDAGSLAAGTLAVTGGSGRVRLANGIVSGGATVRSDATAAVGTLDAGAIDIRSGGALTADLLASGAAITTTSASAAIGQANARGGDVALTATNGDLRLGSAQASGAVALTSSGTTSVAGAVTAGGAYRIDAAAIALGATGATANQRGAEVVLLARTGTVVAQGGMTIAATRGISVTANGKGGGIAFAPETTITGGSGDVALATRGAAALGSVGAANGAVRLDAADATLTRAIAARSVTIANVAATGVTRLGDTALGNDTEFATPTTRFDLSAAELGLVAAPELTIASGARDVVVGALALAPASGSTRFAIAATGRIDMLGRFVAAGSASSRTIAIGGEASGARTATIRVAATPAEGGRLLVDGAALELTADRIGVGFDRDFLDAIGYRAAGLGVEQVTRDYVARPTSTLYNAGGLGAQPYSDLVLVRSGSLALTYGRYALIQNTGRPGEQQGVTIGTLGGGAGTGPTLRLATPGSGSNTFSLFGTIDGISSAAAALLGPDRVQLSDEVSPVGSRINGCVVGSGAGCLNTSIAQPSLNLFDTSRAEIVRTADDLSLPFDPLIGTNNEALYLDPAADETPPPCKGDTPCPTR